MFVCVVSCELCIHALIPLTQISDIFQLFMWLNHLCLSGRSGMLCGIEFFIQTDSRSSSVDAPLSALLLITSPSTQFHHSIEFSSQLTTFRDSSLHLFL